MDWDAIQRNWKRVGATAATRWPGLSEADVTRVDGDRQRLDALVAAHIGISLQEARHQTQEWGLRQEADPSDVTAKPAPLVKPQPLAKPQADVNQAMPLHGQFVPGKPGGLGQS